MTLATKKEGPASFHDHWYFTVGMMVVVLVTTMFIRVPIPSRGYFNFGDVAVVFGGLLLGRRGGFLAGGIGSALADVVGGYAMFAPLTLIAKGVEGYVCGLAHGRSGWSFHLLPLLGTLLMAVIYFVGETAMPQIGLAGALAEVVPNLIQVAGGFLGGKALYLIFTGRRLAPHTPGH